jgi:hypothetical protein
MDVGLVMCMPQLWCVHTIASRADVRKCDAPLIADLRGTINDQNGDQKKRLVTVGDQPLLAS